MIANVRSRLHLSGTLYKRVPSPAGIGTQIVSAFLKLGIAVRSVPYFAQMQLLGTLPVEQTRVHGVFRYLFDIFISGHFRIKSPASFSLDLGERIECA